MTETPRDPKDVAIAALVNLVRLMGSELVAGRHRDDPDLLEHAIRSKIAAFAVEGCPADVNRAGVDLAMSQAVQAVKQIRAQGAAVQAHEMRRPAPAEMSRNLH